MSKLKIIWEGKISLCNVSWNLDRSNEFFLSYELEKQRKQIWEETLKRYPDSYDGSLLVLTDFKTSSDAAILKTGKISFSRILTLDRHRLGLDAYGCLGFQTIILSPKKMYILLGKRSQDHIYCPLHYAGPGGMLEVSDAKGSVQDACLREIQEEAEIDLQPDLNLVAIVPQLHGTVGTGLIISSVAAEPIDVEASVAGNEEWEDHSLEWYSVEKLRSFVESSCLEGPIFAREEYLKYQNGKRSVLWP